MRAGEKAASPESRQWQRLLAQREAKELCSGTFVNRGGLEPPTRC
jgi:hypothetical protein